MNNVAETILSQLGGTGRLAAMLGAKNFLGSADSVQFRFAAKAKNRANSCRIVLDASDTYTVELWSIRGLDVRRVSEASGIYADSLRAHIEAETGLYLSI